MKKTVHQGERGTLEISSPAPSIVLTKLTGHFSADLIPHYLTAMDAAAKSGAPVLGFHDWAELAGYESAARHALTDWVMAHRQPGACQHIFLKSALVKMGVATANLLIGGAYLSTHQTRASFEAALRRAVEGAATNLR